MARSAEGAALTQQHRLVQIRVRANALRDLRRLWRGVDPLNLAGTVGLFGEAAATIVRVRHQNSAAVAGRYFREFRRLEGISGTVAVVSPPAPPERVAGGVLRAAGLAGIVNGRRRGFSPQAAAQNGFVKVAQSASNLVLSGGREVIIAATAADSRSTGRWQRVTGGDPCSFCAALASRGAVFTAGTADFEAHGACACMAEPVYEGSRMPPVSERFRQRWDETTEGLSGRDALNAFRRALSG